MKFLTGLVNGHNEQHQKEKNIKYIQKDMRARDGAGQDHENCDVNHDCKRLVRTVLIFTESSDQLSRATDRVPGLPASPGYVQ